MHQDELAQPIESRSINARIRSRRAADRTSGGSFSRMATLLFLAYMVIAVGLYVGFGVRYTPDTWVFALLIGAIVLGRAVDFLKDWIPFVLLIFGYEFLRGIAGHIVLGEKSVLDPGMATDHGRIQAESLINADLWLFRGTLPTTWVQTRYYDPGVVHWYDIVSVVIYGMHFVFPLVFAFLLWLHSRNRFVQFSLSFLAMTYAGFLVFILFPAAPPWLTAHWGMITDFVTPSTQTVGSVLPKGYGGGNSFKLWTQASPNPVAAMPSLHTAFPWLVTLFGLRSFGKKALVFLPYNFMLWFAVVYLGHHWVVDIIAGILWATLWYAVVMGASTLIERRKARTADVAGPLLAPDHA